MHHQGGELRTGLSPPLYTWAGGISDKEKPQTLPPSHKDTSREFLLKIALSRVSKMSSQGIWELGLGIKEPLVGVSVLWLILLSQQTQECAHRDCMWLIQHHHVLVPLFKIYLKFIPQLHWSNGLFFTST